MTQPNIQYKATNTELDTTLQSLLESKLESLQKFYTEENSVRFEVEFEKETAHQSGKHFRVEVNMHKDGELFRAEASEHTFEEAIDEVRDELDKSLRRAAKKHDTLVRRGGRAIKKMMRMGGE